MFQNDDNGELVANAPDQMHKTGYFMTRHRQ